MRALKPTVLEEIMTGLDYFRYSLFEAVCTTYRFAENSVNVSSYCANDLLKYSRHEDIMAFHSELVTPFDRLYILMKGLLFRALLNLERGLVVIETAILLVCF